MRFSFGRLALCAILVACLATIVGREAQGSDKPLFTDFPSNMLCTNGPFVAMATEQPKELIVVRIGKNGIDQPRRLLLNYDGVYGMKCNWQRVELLVQAPGSDRFSRLPFSIRDDRIQQEQPEVINYSISGRGPTPPEEDDFHVIPTLLRQTHGDWYIRIVGVPSKRSYELHCVKAEKPSRRGLRTSFTVDLLEESVDGKVIRSVPLIGETRFEPSD